MKLYEFEGHKILNKVGIESPFFVVCSDIREVMQARKRLKFPIVAKIQVLSGRRGKSGGVKMVSNEKALINFAKEFFGKEFPPGLAGEVGLGEKVRFIALSQKVDVVSESYISITYDTKFCLPFILYSPQGGVEIEEIQKSNPDAIIRLNFDPVAGPNAKELKKLEVPVDLALRLWDAFWRYDCRLVEVNPLALRKTQGSSRRFTSVRAFSASTLKGKLQSEGEYVAVDAKVILDDAGLIRHRDLDVLPKGATSAIPSNREIEAEKIDREDYRGSAGSTFIELDGDIAILASGGGASLLVIDAVVAAGGAPANYTEYSGNPPAEKVERLTKITLSKVGLSGCLVAGAVANFTDIYETLSGFVEGLRQVKPKPIYPIVIRRGGPRQTEAYKMLEKVAKVEGYDIHLFGGEMPISVACRKMVELAKNYKIRNPKHPLRKRSEASEIRNKF